MKTKYRILVPVAALLLSSTGLLAEAAPPVTTPPERTPPAARPNENASDTAKAVQALLDQFRAQRDQFLAARQALIDQLKTATGDERKAILEQLRTDQQARVDEQRALGKQIRDEIKNVHRDHPTGG